MKTSRIMSKLVIFLLLLIHLALMAQDNTFNGTINNDWDNANNWSTGKVPPSTIVQKITIAANCEVPISNGTNYTFMEGSTFQINSGIIFTNNGAGTWTMNGLFDKAGNYVGNFVNNGVIEPGDNTSTWACGNQLIYGGQSYSTVQIGGQCWMAENINIGTKIDGYGSEDQSASNVTIEKYCYVDSENNCNTYGGLYQWNEMMQGSTIAGVQGICPTGWHLPTDDEWKSLEKELGMSQSEADNTGWRGVNEGSKMADNAALWNDGALEGDSEFGSSNFAVLPAGYYYDDEEDFYGKNSYTMLWSSSESSSKALYRNLNSNFTKVYRESNYKNNGYSVRCVRN